MGCTVIDYDPESKSLEVKTETGKQFCVFPFTEKVEGSIGTSITYHPVRLGYAKTVQRLQGQTLDHVTFWPDACGCKAAGYVALSRVRTDKDYLIGGAVVPCMFMPA